VVEERSVQARSSCREWGRRVGGGVVRRRGARVPFYRVRGGVGQPDREGRGIGRPVVRRHYGHLVQWVEETEEVSGE
jgi:hypothetical protein